MSILTVEPCHAIFSPALSIPFQLLYYGFLLGINRSDRSRSR